MTKLDEVSKNMQFILFQMTMDCIFIEYGIKGMLSHFARIFLDVMHKSWEQEHEEIHKGT